MSVTLDKASHVYMRNGRSYISATTVVDLYVPAYDSEYWSTYKALKDILEPVAKWKRYKFRAGGWEKVVEYYRRNGVGRHEEVFRARKRYYLELWEKQGKIARDKGTAVHAILEQSTSEMQRLERHEGLILIPSTAQDLLAAQDFSSSGVYSELKVYNDYYRIAGTIDKVQKVSRTVYITDYKTSKQITDEPFRGQTMLPPFDTIPNANLYHYTFQLGIYAFMLEQAGYIIGSLTIEHRDRETAEWLASIRVGYDRGLVRQMLDDCRSKYLDKAKIQSNA